MFKLMEPDAPCEWPVTVHVPHNGGKTTPQRFTAHFAYLAADEIGTLSDQGDEAFLARVLVGWDGVVDANGDAIPFSPEHRDAMARIPYVRRALVLAWHEYIQGRAAKN